jgi:UDP-N-acetylglucosamine--N-acetylmuramyl-(pentapeptide) pyrophosphoryl-undecaprenol N-acetylglucosamine transferase
MELALGAATVAVSRAGASTLAELAAMRLPSLLIPYPAAADNHQFYNARAFADRGAARLLDQRQTTPEEIAREVSVLLQNEQLSAQMRENLESLHSPAAASLIADKIMHLMRAHGKWESVNSHTVGPQRPGLQHSQVSAI